MIELFVSYLQLELVSVNILQRFMLLGSKRTLLIVIFFRSAVRSSSKFSSEQIVILTEILFDLNSTYRHWERLNRVLLV